MRKHALLATLFFTCAPWIGAQNTLQDDLLDRMAGKWTFTGTIRGQSVRHSVEARWILNHQFLEIHEMDTATPSKYEALVLVGRDDMSERYVTHWNDIFGGRVSETLGYGTRSGDQIELVFEYPDGPFHTVFRWVAATKQWEWHMRTKNAKGQWEDFAHLTTGR